MPMVLEQKEGDTSCITYMDQEGQLYPDCKHSVDNETLLRGYKEMLKVRLLEDRMVKLQRQGVISFAMTSLGEEACAVASAAALSNEDWLYPQYREAGIMFWRGFSIEQWVHSMFCNGKDLIKGRQMPNHFGDRSLNVVTVSSPIGTKIPHAAGAAYAMRVQGKETVAVSYFGEGAASEGDFHAGLNFAAVRRAPAIFFCRNNGYAISTSSDSQYVGKDIASRGPGYGMKTFQVDGNDFIAVYEVTAAARDYCLKEGKPVLIEAMTYRHGAHSTSDDPTRYRSSEEENSNAQKDPIKRLGAHLRFLGLWNQEKEEHYIEEVKQEIDRAIDAARHAPAPELDSLFEDVCFTPPQLLEEQQREATRFFGEEASS